MLSKANIKLVLTDIRFWILLLFLIRLIGIMNPPLESGHNWRQSLTNMVARNFFTDGPNLLYPKIDMAGAKTGIIASEFPFFNYLIYLFSSIFDYSHWYGRLINLIVSSIGIYYFYLLLTKLFDKKVAFGSAIILLSSIWFAFSRKIMPDTFSVSLVIIGLYYCYTYLKNGKVYHLLLFFSFITLGVLCKIPNLSLFVLLGIPLLLPQIELKRKTALVIASVISFVCISWWYFYWAPHLLETYQFQLFFPKGLLEGFREITPLFGDLMEKFYFSSLRSYLAFAGFLAGLYFVFRSKNNHLKIGVSLVLVTFLAFVLKTGAVFPMHSYYIIPFTPLMAFVAGYAFSKLDTKYLYIGLGLILIEGIANQQHDLFIKDSERYKLTLEQVASETTNPTDLIIINGGQGPQQIYFTNRKGWTVDNETINNNEGIQQMIDEGAKYLILNKLTFGGAHSTFKPIYESEYYAVYSLQN